MLTVCAWCGVRIAGRSGNRISHGICLDCLEANFPELLNQFNPGTLKRYDHAKTRIKPDNYQAA